MNEFDGCEKQGRELFLKILQAAKVTEYEFSTDSSSIGDAKYTTDKVENIIEIKVRKQDYLTYPDGILELKKYNALKVMAEDKQKETDKIVSAYYINFFSDGYFCFGSINDIDVSTVVQKRCKATTAVNSGYIDKAILPLKIKDSVMFGQIDSNNKVIKLDYERTITKENS